MASKPWVLTQLGGFRNTLTLDGRFAPHGRERKSPIFEEELSLRKTRTRYGGSDVPTTHIFGGQSEPFELHGRFDDRHAGGPGSAKKKKVEVKNFWDDKQRIRIAWGDVAAWIGYLDKVRFGSEAEHAIVWKMTFEIDVDLDLPNERQLNRYQLTSPSDYMKGIGKYGKFVDQLKAEAFQVPLTSLIASLSQFVTDTISDLLSTYTSAFGVLSDLSDTVTSFENAIIGDLRRIRAAGSQLSSAMLKIQDAFAQFVDDQALTHQTGNTALIYQTTLANAEDDLRESLALLADMDRAAELAERGRVDTMYTAQDGDTWETISRQVYGNMSLAQVIKDANGIRGGQLPNPGQSYHIPAAT